jgi:serine/threonine-protein kinase
MLPQKLAQYELLEKLDHLRGGEVYKAREVATAREVLVRLLPAELATALRDQGHNAEEARRILRLSHPNVLTVYEFRFSNGHPFVVSEPFDGYTLGQRLFQGPLPLEEVLTIATSVAAGLRYAHEQEVVHGHLNPEHIWLSPKGEVKVANFGFNRLRNGVAKDLLGQQARRYESPEQWRGQRATAASDVFAFGLVLQEMLVGHPPVRDEDGGVRLDSKPKRRGHGESAFYDRVHPGLWQLVRQCTALDPAARPSFSEIQRDLVAANALYVEASKKYAWRSPNPYWRGQLWRRHFMSAAVVIGLVGLLTAIGLVLFR